MAAETVTVNVSRYDPETGDPAHFDSFAVPAYRGMTVQEALFYILENLDDSIAFRYSCRGAVCGACAMVINDEPRLACQTQMLGLGAAITVAPLPQLRVIRDLVVDMQPFWDRLESVKPYIIRKSAYPEKEVLQTPEQLAVIEELSICVQCGICDATFPSVWGEEGQLGPGALVRAARFVLDSRDEAKQERLSLLFDDQGQWNGRVVHDSTDSCPKGIHISAAIESLEHIAAETRGGQP